MTQDEASMERLRTNLIRRAQAERRGEEGENMSTSNEPSGIQETSHTQGSRLRTLFPRLFTRSLQDPEAAGAIVESPKTPDFRTQAPVFPSSRPTTSSFSRPWTSSSNRPSPQPETTRVGTAPSLSPQESHQTLLSQPEPVAASPTSHSGSHHRSRLERFTSPDPAEVHLATLAEDGRRRRRRRHTRTRSNGSGHPRRFLFCFPWVKSRQIRSQILRCFVSGSFLIMLLTVYLALLLTKNINSSEMTIFLILVIIFGTVFFCHGLIRLVMLVVRGDRDESDMSQLPQMYGPGGYAIPSRPIPVVLARDEEAVGVESVATKSQPPAYGLWRESVRVDPNRIFWQRTPNADQIPTRPETRSGPRPPSYISEDGVSYVVEAVPRSTAPSTDVPLPPHPSEVGRTAWTPTL